MFRGTLGTEFRGASTRVERAIFIQTLRGEARKHAGQTGSRIKSVFARKQETDALSKLNTRNIDFSRVSSRDTVVEATPQAFRKTLEYIGETSELISGGFRYAPRGAITRGGTGGG